MVKDLIQNDWLHVTAIDPDTGVLIKVKKFLDQTKGGLSGTEHEKVSNRICRFRWSDAGEDAEVTVQIPDLTRLSATFGGTGEDL